MKIAFFELDKWADKIVGQKLKKDNIKIYRNTISKSKLKEISDCEALCVFIYSKVNREVLDNMPKLKLICTMSTGFDHIDLEECKKRKIKVCNVPTYGNNTVAEHTFALVLALSRHLFQSIERTHIDQKFETDSTLRGFDLRAKTIGLIGCGQIGMHVARMAKGFEMEVLVFDLNKDEKLAKKIGFKYSSMNNLLKKSDFISLHVPYNNKTHHIIGKDAISKMKDGVSIINTARGGLIDTKALVSGLKSKKIGGAGLDVLEEECEVMEESSLLTSNFKAECDLQTVLANHMLMKMDNVLITPHNAFNSTEALERILNTTIDNILNFKKKKVKNNVV